MMTETEIEKALEYCKDCSANLNIEIIECIYRKNAEIKKCVDTLCKKEDMMQLIAEERNQYYDELQAARAEIERLNKEISTFDVFYFCSYSGCEAISNKCWKTCPNSVYNKTRAEAIKEFTERFESKLNCIPQHHFTLAQVLFDLDKTKKEMVGDTE